MTKKMTKNTVSKASQPKPTSQAKLRAENHATAKPPAVVPVASQDQLLNTKLKAIRADAYKEEERMLNKCRFSPKHDPLTEHALFMILEKQERIDLHEMAKAVPGFEMRFPTKPLTAEECEDAMRTDRLYDIMLGPRKKRGVNKYVQAMLEFGLDPKAGYDDGEGEWTLQLEIDWTETGKKVYYFEITYLRWDD